MSVVETDIQTMAETFRGVVGLCAQQVGADALVSVGAALPNHVVRPTAFSRA